MTWHSTEFWEIVLDVIGLMLCGTTIIYLIRNKSEYRQNLLKPREPEERETQDFENVLVRSLNQTGPALKPVPDNTEDEENTQEEGLRFADERYGEAIRLADSGMNPKEISKRTKIPKSEVELVVKLKKEAEAADGGWPEKKPSGF